MTNLENAKVLFSGNAVELSFADGIALVKIDCKDNAKVNLLSSAVMAELDTVGKILDGTQVTPGLPQFSGVVFYSGKADCFIAGADIKEILTAQELPNTQVFEACQQGKAVLDRFARLSVPTVCAVHGRCLGGGMEAFLRFQYRLASNSPKTVFGLPEVGLGVIPGWGGCIILPKMVGYANAAWMVLNPLKPWSAKKAKKLGVVHEVLPEEKLLARAIEIASGGKAPKPYRRGIISGAVRSCLDTRCGRWATEMLFWPLSAYVSRFFGDAPETVQAVMDCAFELPERDAMITESKTFAWLTKTSGCRKSVQRFLNRKKKS